ncbi:MAG TPA: HEAT repeat domain-containing protein [Candidatus Brocadiia bacterium]|nr:HEAT repeat domain-containing protein [Candidatus Brocadiia bacterium]
MKPMRNAHNVIRWMPLPGALLLALMGCAQQCADVAPPLASAQPNAKSEAGKPVIRVLLLSGANNHDWRSTTPVVKAELEAVGRFSVDVTEQPEKMDPAMLPRYDVIVSNWTNFPNVNDRIWPPALEQAFLDYMREGGGLVVIHAATATFQNWPEFQQIVCTTWGKDTGHGSINTFPVSISDANHPVTRGLRDFWITDELWHRVPVQPAANVLCAALSYADKGGTGNLEPVLLTTSFGKGRCADIVLGHDANAMRNPAWQTILCRSAEWAATGMATIPPAENWPETAQAGELAAVDADSALKAIAGYQFGQNRDALILVETLTHGAETCPGLRKRLRGGMVALLNSGATLECKKFVCRQLSLIGSPEDIPALLPLLEDKDLSFYARQSLERIPGEEASATLRGALGRLQGSLLAGVINSLGARRDETAVPAISERLNDPDPIVAGAAIDALGRIANPAATDALRRCAVPGKLQPLCDNALLCCADALRRAGKIAEALAIYREMSAAEKPRHIRTAAFPGLIACEPEKSSERILAALRDGDPAFRTAALRCARDAPDAGLVRALAAEMPLCPPSLQLGVIDALAVHGDSASLSAIAVAAESDHPDVRKAAIRALGQSGDASCVALLARLAAAKGNAETRLARRSLIRLPDREADAEMARLLEASESAVQCELLIALAERGAASAMPDALRMAKSRDPNVRREALRAAGALGDASAIPELLSLLHNTPNDSERRNIENSLAAICRKSGEPDAAAEPILKALPDKDPGVRASLLRALCGIGGGKALAAARESLKDGDEAVRAAAARALGDWSDSAPMTDLLDFARSCNDPALKALALRGVAQLAGRTGERPQEETAKLFAEAMGIASLAADKKALLGGIANAPSQVTLQLAADCISDPELTDEAALAVARIASACPSITPEDARAALRKAFAAAAAPSARKAAAEALLRREKPTNLSLAAAADSPDGIDTDGASGPDQAGIDGNPVTYWDETDNLNLYRYRITYKQPTDVNAITILCHIQMGQQPPNYAPRDFDVICDGNVVATITDAHYENREFALFFPTARCSTVELRIFGRYGPSPCIQEFGTYNMDEFLNEAKTQTGDAADPAVLTSDGLRLSATSLLERTKP